MTDIFGGFLAGVLGERYRRRSLYRPSDSGRIQCVFRLLSGNYPPLSKRSWDHAKAEISRGKIVVGKTTIVVDSVCRRYQRQPTNREKWDIAPELLIVELHCGDAVVEWGVPDRLLGVAIDRLAVPLS